MEKGRTLAAVCLNSVIFYLSSLPLILKPRHTQYIISIGCEDSRFYFIKRA